MNIYAENILDHFRHPRNYGTLQAATIVPRTDPKHSEEFGAWVEHEEWNHACGDSLHVWVKMRPSTGSGQSRLIVGIGWTGEGCAISQASMSLLSEELPGMDEAEALKMNKDRIYALLGVPIGPRRIKCALMSLHTVKNALHKAAGKPLQSWAKTVALEREG